MNPTKTFPLRGREVKSITSNLLLRIFIPRLRKTRSLGLMSATRVDGSGSVRCSTETLEVGDEELSVVASVSRLVVFDDAVP